MEKLITMSIFLTEMFTLFVLGLLALAACVVIFDYLKKNISIEKQIKREKDNPDIYEWEKGFGSKEEK